MPVPSFYKAEQVGQLFRPDVTRAVTEGAGLGIAPAAADERRIMLLLVDVQMDFVHPQGSLSVPGAVEDTRRVIEWLFEHSGQVTTIAASLDSHIPIQIFYPTWWVDDSGSHPEAYTVITSDEVEAGRWQPVYEPEWSKQYVAVLEKQAKKQLMIWPYHTMIGTEGHNLMPALYEAIAYHTAARQTQPVLITKGMIPQTEHYSMLEPELKVPEHPQGDLNQAFLAQLESHDLIYIAGQAKSHCVLETALSLMRYYGERSEMVNRFRVLIDCTSSVAHPEIDFEAQANKAYAEMREQGLSLVKSTDGID